MTNILLAMIIFFSEWCVKRVWWYERKNQQFIKDFNIFIKVCYRIVWSVEKNAESKKPKEVRRIKEKLWFQ